MRPAATRSDARRRVFPRTRADRDRSSRSSADASEIGVNMRLLAGARMRHGAVLGVADGLGVAPDGARLVIVGARLPFLAARRKLGIAQHDVDRALVDVERNDVAVADQGDRAADRRLRPDMADAEAACRARETAIGDKRDLAAGPLAVERRGGRQHLAHARTAARPLVADDEHLALL